MRDECFGGVATTSTLSFYHILKALVGTLSIFSKFFSTYNYKDDRRTETQHGESDKHIAEGVHCLSFISTSGVWTSTCNSPSASYKWRKD